MIYLTEPHIECRCVTGAGAAWRWRTARAPQAPALAERAKLFCLMLAHRYNEARANAAAGVAYRSLATELAGKFLGLVGFGASAIRFARLARKFGTRLAAVDIRDISDAEVAEQDLEGLV